MLCAGRWCCLFCFLFSFYWLDGWFIVSCLLFFSRVHCCCALVAVQLVLGKRKRMRVFLTRLLPVVLHFDVVYRGRAMQTLKTIPCVRLVFFFARVNYQNQRKGTNPLGVLARICMRCCVYIHVHHNITILHAKRLFCPLFHSCLAYSNV